MRVALVYDRVNKWGGAERVLLALHEMFPQAPLYTSVYNPRRAPWASVFPKVYTSCLQGVALRTHHEWLAPLMPIAFEQFNFDQYDLVISVTSEAAKGIITKPRTRHVCYCLTPTRYLWSGYDIYFGDELKRWITQPVVSYLRDWDKIAAQRTDVMVGISQEVAGRIKRYYGREAKVIYPPVDIGAFARQQKFSDGENFDASPRQTIPYFLVVSRLVPYKKVDLAIEAFNKLDLPLAVVGKGSEEGKLRRMAQNNIRFINYLTDQELASYYEKAAALIFPQEEDFGIASVEAQSLGTPVIAYNKGGAAETIIPGKTGEFFNQQTTDALIKAVKNFNRSKYDAKFIKNYAKKFSKGRFKREFIMLLSKLK